MNLEERIMIQMLIKEGKKIYEIGKQLNKSTTTISNEIKKHRQPIPNLKSTTKRTYEEIRKIIMCDLLNVSPFVCNNCPLYNKQCTKDNLVYNAKYAQHIYEVNKSISNKGSRFSKEVIEYIQNKISLGQPITHIMYITNKNKGICPSKTTIYKWISKGIINYANKRKIRKKLKTEQIKYVDKREFLKGLEYTDFIKYICENPDSNIIEMDLLCGKQGEYGYIMTLYMPKIQFLLGFKIENKTPFEVLKVLNYIENKIGLKRFREMFGVIITDRGSEFLKHESLCESIKEQGLRRTKIFYCDAGTPTQKPNVENIHKLVRKVFVKGSSFLNITNDDVLKVVNNINSLIKPKYKNKTPNDLFIEYFGKTIFKKLSLEIINEENVVLKPFKN